MHPLVWSLGGSVILGVSFLTPQNRTTALILCLLSPSAGRVVVPCPWLWHALCFQGNLEEHSPPFHKRWLPAPGVQRDKLGAGGWVHLGGDGR